MGRAWGVQLRAGAVIGIGLLLALATTDPLPPASGEPGPRAAIEGGVDILAHTFPSELDRRPWDRALPGMMIERRMGLVPTLKLFPYELRKLGLPPAVAQIVLGNAQAQLRAFADAGDQVLFGTDVGYMTEYDPTDDYMFMQQAGSPTRAFSPRSPRPPSDSARPRGRAASPPASPRTWWCWGTRSVTFASSPRCATAARGPRALREGLVSAA